MAYKQFHKANEICESAVEQWYKGYTPRIYRRRTDKNFYDVYDARVNKNGEFEFTLDENNLGWHRASNDYIFENSFVQGFHGGPIWPWSDPPRVAAWDIPPYVIITTKWNAYLEGQYLKEQREAVFSVLGKYCDMFERKQRLKL